MKQASKISIDLLQWHESIDRNLPWKKDRDPYKIWLSEIIMQQTRIEQGTPYYLRFVDAYPTIDKLAHAPLDDVLKLWEGLGYYSRARNLHYAANQVMDEFGGVFPVDYPDVLSLKGVGKYTAAAIVSFAYDQSYPVVDGNVLRVISRLYGNTSPIDSKEGINAVYEWSQKIIDTSEPAQYNQAIMDLGSLVCSPRKPKCPICPFAEYCITHKDSLYDTIPHKVKKIKKRDRYFHYFHVEDGQSTLLKKREENDIWKGLYEFPLVETKGKTLTKKARAQFLKEELGFTNYDLLDKVSTKHILSHQNIYATIYRVSVDQLSSESYIKTKDWQSYALPVLLKKYLETVSS